MKEASPGKNKFLRRAKTFTGCWTCRARKIKCDLGKPTCQRCEKSSFQCGGYDIKLQWSSPIQFNCYGQVIPGGNNPAGADEPPSQRRDIAFVKYKEEYEYYEDMDDELSLLHSPPLEQIADDRTWMIKKFAVFRGTEKVKVKHVPRRKRRAQQKISRSMVPIKAGSDQNIFSLNNSDANALSGSSVAEEAGSTISNETNSEIPSASGIANLFNFDFSSVNFKGHEWISNELRDDALLSAFAIQGFSADTPTHSQPDRTQPQAQTPHRNSHENPLDQFENFNTDDGKDLSQIYKILFHRHEDRPRSRRHTSAIEVTDPNAKSSVVPLGDIILIDSAGTEGHMPKEVLEVVESDIPDPTIFNLPDNNNLLLRVPTTSLKVNGLTRFLLNYYLQNVVDLMTVVALQTNPWRTIYFPRALQAIGDLAGIGYTSHSRNSLLNAILAVSCFNLQSKFPKNSPEMKYYLQLGIEFRGQASEFLKTCLELSVKQERYKDILTAILSMNSIDVVWGTMADCQYHLSLCEELVEARMKTRPKISQKARSLHRIFSFLKLIQDSTALDKVTEKEIVLKGAENEDDLSSHSSNHEDGGEFKESLDKVNGKIRIEYVQQQGSNASTPIFTNIASQTYYFPKSATSENNFLDALYGLPNSIILLFSDCVRLARHREYYRMHSSEVPASYQELCTEFEGRLLRWKSEWEFYKPYTEEFVNDTVQGVYHHTMSFYHSLIIYYHTRAQDQEHETVQFNVREALEHLNKLTDLIHNKGVKIVPLIWQGFMAGCAAVNTNLQMQFKEWAAKLADSGMGSYWGARQIMFEVWRRRLNGERCDNWFDVYKDWEMNLMLS
ncbi:LANO_0B08504g1_1 [Lachancea nothofagi CBS 11611]|uniref:LANO_0B08504g1_1 n=1 Tax=Lachancea nothofagi CBS 11611 TaxID=1266666 RepID=A0A1G4J0Y8_9SACH|nr:LANO_0B08504g1_1 [Lachancea nothofagi CBS 11611]